MRKKIVVANWKMNSTKAMSEKIIGEFIAILSSKADPSTTSKTLLDIVICPPSIYLDFVSNNLKIRSSALKNSNFKLTLGAQDTFYAEQGAYTGEISPVMLRDVGCEYVIIGHSERRQIFAEDSDLITKKVQAAIDFNLTPILCVGETEAERKASHTFTTIQAQLEPVLTELNDTDLAKLVIAYEPVWAIGTGLTATPVQAEEVHVYTREMVRKRNFELSHTISILYGGSVKAENAKELFAMPNIDGGLVGGASLVPEEFSTICLAEK